MRKILSVLSKAFLLAGVLVSCGKSAPGGSTSACQIMDVAFTSPDTTQNASYKIYYDEQGRVDSIRENLADGSYVLKTFERTGDLVVMHTLATSYQLTDSIFVNEAGLEVQQLEKSGYVTTLAKFVYTGNELQEGISLIPSGDTTVYQWQNGDMTGQSGLPAFFGYNDKASAIGDYWHLFNLLQKGAPAIVTAHQANYIYLPLGQQTINIAYTYDKDGKIATLTYSGDQVQTVRYQYSCH
jgi:hypothetical protein